MDKVLLLFLSMSEFRPLVITGAWSHVFSRRHKQGVLFLKSTAAKGVPDWPFSIRENPLTN